MAAEPLRSALTKNGADDTSLALPSDNSLRSGHQRVLDQVHTIKRSKSKNVKNGGTSPTSTSSVTLTTHEYGSFKFAPANANGALRRIKSTSSPGYKELVNTQKNRTTSMKSTGRHFSTSGAWEQQINTSVWPSGPNGLKPSSSDPALVPNSAAPVPVMRAKGQTVKSQHSQRTQTNRHSSNSLTNGTHVPKTQKQITRSSSAQYQSEGKMGTIKTAKVEQQSAVNSTSTLDLTIKEAVDFLSQPEENYQQCGATFIQHAAFKEEPAKQEVYQLGGIPPLVSLLRSSSPAVSQAAAGALRNLVFKHQLNKLEVQHCGGIAKALQLLKETDSTETQKQITGLLWNLSSADELREELIATALPALTENVVVPFTCWSDTTANNNIHPDVFHNATGCLRNLTCGKQKERQAMRECRGLIDSLMSYVQSCIAEENPDDKSVENSVCILHNLSFQLETECPDCFRKYQTNTDSQLEKSPVGCFSPKSSKVQKEYTFDMAHIPEDTEPSGASWLCHPTAMQTYLNLLGLSQKDGTLEASSGALQNLTANQGPGSSAMSQILVQRLGALAHISPLLKSLNPSLQKTTLLLLSNMSRNSSVQTALAKQVLPGLTSLLTSGPRELGNSDETVATACNISRSLMLADTEFSKKMISNELVSSLADLSENGSFPKARKAASMLLYTLWNDKNLQGAAKKLGIGKSLFVNENTTAVHRSMQVIE